MVEVLADAQYRSISSALTACQVRPRAAWIKPTTSAKAVSTGVLAGTGGIDVRFFVMPSVPR